MKKALLIGINYLQTTEARLYGCVNDAIAMKNMLNDAYGYSLDNIKVLRDDVDARTEPESMPTRKNMIDAFTTLFNESADLEEIWIHYSGHGSYIRDRNGDEIDGKDEVLIPSDYKQAGIIVDDELRALLNKAKCRVMITMDCCNSGTNWDIYYSFPIINRRIYRRIENHSSMSNPNIYMLSGSRDDQYAGDYFNFESKIPMGIFTMALLECLRRRNHKVSLLQLYLDINAHLDANNMQQDCLLSSSNRLPFTNVERARPGAEVGGTRNRRIVMGDGSYNASRETEETSAGADANTRNTILSNMRYILGK